jgi:hypothetical protein
LIFFFVRLVVKSTQQNWLHSFMQFIQWLHYSLVPASGPPILLSLNITYQIMSTVNWVLKNLVLNFGIFKPEKI